MGDDHASGATGDTSESLKVERANMEDAFAFVRQTVEYFDTLWDDGKSFDPERVAFHLQLKDPDMRLRVWAGITTPEGFQWHKEALAQKKAVGEEVLKDVAGFGQDLIDWAEDLEKREARYKQSSAGLAGAVAAGATAEAPTLTGPPLESPRHDQWPSTSARTTGTARGAEFRFGRGNPRRRFRCRGRFHGLGFRYINCCRRPCDEYCRLWESIWPK